MIIIANNINRDDNKKASKNIKLILTIRALLVILGVFFKFCQCIIGLILIYIGKDNKDETKNIIPYFNLLPCFILLCLFILLLVTLIKGRSEVKYSRALIAINIINIIVIFFFMTHVLSFFLSLYLNNINKFVDKIEKIHRFRPIVYFEGYCIIIFHCCFQSLVLFIFNDIILPIMIVFLLQDKKNSFFYKRNLLLILCILQIAFASIIFIFDTKYRYDRQRKNNALNTEEGITESVIINLDLISGSDLESSF